METKCVLLLWMYILVLIPFDLSTVDTSIVGGEFDNGVEISPLVVKILEISKGYLSSAGPMRRISGLVLSRLLTRPDMPKAFNRFLFLYMIMIHINKFFSELRQMYHFSMVSISASWSGHMKSCYL